MEGTDSVKNMSEWLRNPDLLKQGVHKRYRGKIDAQYGGAAARLRKTVGFFA